MNATTARLAILIDGADGVWIRSLDGTMHEIDSVEAVGAVVILTIGPEVEVGQDLDGQGSD